MVKKKLIFTIILCVVFFQNTSAQNSKNGYLFNSFTAGTSLTYFWDNDSEYLLPDEHFYQELSWNVNFVASMGKRMNAGVQVISIFKSGTHVETETLHIYGILAQYDFFWKTGKRSSLIVETSINKGNSCYCGHLDPYRRNNLWYFGSGAGVELPLNFVSKRLFLDAAFFTYYIINPIQTKYTFTQYIIGLNYKIGKLKK